MAACGVTGTPGGEITFPSGGPSFSRVRKPDGSMRQDPQGMGTWLYWPCSS